MPAKRVKTILSYVLILAAGLGIGSGVPYVVNLLKPAYATGDYSAYYPDKQSNVVLYGTSSCAIAFRRALIYGNAISHSSIVMFPIRIKVTASSRSLAGRVSR